MEIKSKREIKSNMEAILKVEKLKKYYGTGESVTKALDGISFQVMPGEFLGIMGSSGSGKSTLLNCLATITKVTDGTVLFKNRNISEFSVNEFSDYRGKETGYLFQDFELLDNLTGKENILLPLSLHSCLECESDERLSMLAKYFDIMHVLNKFPHQMSGGEKQRVAAARALILNPNVVFADEPTGALDSKNARNLMEKLLKMNNDFATTILMVTHDYMSAGFCNRILFIKDGKILHEIRRDVPTESREDFYKRIITVMSGLGGDSSDF